MRDIGKNIRDIRISQNMTQDALAEALFVTRQTVSNYENGRSRPDIEMMLKIAEILETDVNSILYGVPVPECKRNAYKRLWITLSILAGLVSVYLLICIIYEQDMFAFHAILQIGKLLVLPAAALLSGWMLMHILSMFCNLKQLKDRKRKICRIIFWSCMGIALISILPNVVFLIISFILSMTRESHSISMGLPIWNQISFVVLMVTYKIPFLYAVLGGACWMSGIPKNPK